MAFIAASYCTRVRYKFGMVYVDDVSNISTLSAVLLRFQGRDCARHVHANRHARTHAARTRRRLLPPRPSSLPISINAHLLRDLYHRAHGSSVGIISHDSRVPPGAPRPETVNGTFFGGHRSAIGSCEGGKFLYADEYLPEKYERIFKTLPRLQSGGTDGRYAYIKRAQRIYHS